MLADVMTLRRLAVATLVFGLSACSSIGRARPVPLYPHPEQSPPAEMLAQLQGPIRAVDGFDVESRGTTFDLLPGCHVVVLKPKIGAGSELGAWSADLGFVAYAFRMLPGRLYSIEPETSFGSAGHGSVRINAYERNADGSVSGTAVPIRDQAEVEACHAWAESAGYRPLPVGSKPAGAPKVPMNSSFAQ
jgi:hypothetical protein